MNFAADVRHQRRKRRGLENGASSPAGLLTISNTTLVIRIRFVVFSFVASTVADGGMNVALTWQQLTSVTPIPAMVSPAAFDAGIIPLSVGGAWTFTGTTDPTQLCQAVAAPESFTGTCSGSVDWPRYLVERPTVSTSYLATRTSVLDSEFGDLGGTWAATATNIFGVSGCTATFQGSTFSSTCSATGSLDGDVQLTFSGDGFASGTGPHGVELSAQRR